MDEVKHIALLSRLKLTPEEIDLYSKQLERILEYIEKLKEVNTENVPPTFYPIPLENVWREDKVTRPFPVDKTLSNAPERSKTYFKVPRIIE